MLVHRIRICCLLVTMAHVLAACGPGGSGPTADNAQTPTNSATTSKKPSETRAADSPAPGSSLKAKDAQTAARPLESNPAKAAVGYIQPPENFMKSFISMGGDVIGEDGMRIMDFHAGLSQMTLDNGKHPVVNGWTQNDNVYILHFTAKGIAQQVAFKHVLGGLVIDMEPEAKGKFSSVEYLSDGKRKATGDEAYQFVMQVLMSGMMKSAK